MKILELRFKNLNSLYGEWFIDFSAPEYAANGIFALTGPTGAGKSTILDAVCLALYGATPRLGRITKNSNEIMSRQTGECYAEVRFASQAGQFRCHWSQHRARKKASGDLQNPRHEIAEGIVNGRVIEHQLRRVAAVIEEKTGMDFERFTRSILLAQGGFDTFLKAEVEQKSRILEQITGTEIYTEISQRVHERQREERDNLHILRAETAGIVILEPEREKELSRELKEKQKREAEITARVSATGKAIRWLNDVEGLKQEISSLAAEADKLRLELELCKPARKRLNRALKAAELEGRYGVLTAARQEQGVDQKAVQGAEETLPVLESSLRQEKDALRQAERQSSGLREEQKKAAPLLHEIRVLDLQLAEKQKAVDNRDEYCQRDEKQIRRDRKRKAAEEKKRTASQDALRAVEKYLAANSRDEWLVGGLAGIEEQLGGLLSMQQELAAKKKSRAKAKVRLEAVSNKLAASTNWVTACRQELDEVRKQLELKKKDLEILLADRLLREYRAAKDALLQEKVFRRKIADLESERVRLEDGRPCPLCGAEAHPFARGNIPEVDVSEHKIETLSGLIRQAEELEFAVKELETGERDSLKKLTDREKYEAEAANSRENADQYLTDSIEDLNTITLRFSGLQKSALAKLQLLGIEKIPGMDLSSLLGSLKKRLNRWQGQLQKRAEIEQQITGLNSKLKSLEAVIATRAEALIEKRTELNIIREELAAGNSNRRELFGVKSPDVEEKRLAEALARAEQAEKPARTAHDEARQRLDSARINISLLQERIAAKAAELKSLESEFKVVGKAAGFADEQQFLAMRMPVPERNRLQARARKLDDWQTDLQARQKDRENRLAVAIDKKITEARLEDLEPAYKELEKRLILLREEIAEAGLKLFENNTAKERIKKKQSAIEAQKRECGRWEKLHGLIGSADGKKYRNFAQGLTFEIMVSRANRQLAKMTDRYLLLRDDKQPLELNVIDNYQAGEIRSTKNLSGGESFVVSLTLALGLAKMASRKVRVDSLFLDEGFGTLDEEALDAALETLGGLQQGGKLIGVISHIPAVKERIRTQINILPVSGGRSIISGPGCKRLRSKKKQP